MSDPRAQERRPDRHSEGGRPARTGRVQGIRRGCGCRRTAGGRPRCMRLHIPRVHLEV